MGKWELDDKNEPRQSNLDSKVGEDQAMANNAKDVGVARSGSQQPSQEPSKPKAVAQEVKEAVKLDSKKEGDQDKKEGDHGKKEGGNLHGGRPNVVSILSELFSFGFRFLSACTTYHLCRHSPGAGG